MHYFIRKYALIVTSIALCLFLHSAVRAGPVGSQQAQKAAETFLKARYARASKGFSPLSVRSQVGPAGLREIRCDDGTVLAYITELEPRGFIATSADTDMTPIIAYSFMTSFPADNDIKNPLFRMLKADMKLRARALVENEQFNTAENRKLWNLYAGNDPPDAASETFAQWPEENTTLTGGWLETVWNQGEPYNDFCPLDPVDANRSVVGCVATAMAQVVNYHKQCDVHFDNDDSYITIAGINFDSDSDLYDFPNFRKLNEYITAVQTKYHRSLDINDEEAAALSFACGLATKMDYSSEGSGATSYDLRNAFLDKFGYYSADMIGGLSGEVYQILHENMINGLPALLGISPPDGWGGHLIVCDGYNTNGAYHLNFGWGPEHPDVMTEVWYYLPGNLMSDLSIVTETILNVQLLQPEIEVEPSSLSFYAVPWEESDRQSLHIENHVEGAWINSISSSEGFVIAKWGQMFSDYMESFQLEGPGSGTTIYVMFLPEEARGYNGTLEINYGDGNRKYVILNGYSFRGETEIPAGEVSGTWMQAQSPYFVSGDIAVPRNGELIIEPGVRIFFAGPYGMTVRENARLAAEGTENNPIEFTAWNKDVGWTGLRFLESGGDDILNHCHISYSKKNPDLLIEYVYEADANTCGGAIYCYMSDPIITNCKITNNSGNRGGAIYCDESYPIISNTVIANNASLGGEPQCGGICTGEYGEPEIINCTIVNNLPGGIFSESAEGISLTNTIVWGNNRYQIQAIGATPDVTFCDIQHLYQGLGNIDSDPCFLEPSMGAGNQYDGLAANWMLKSCSPCINSGRRINFAETDIAGNERINADIIDIGAYENQSELPLITIAPTVTTDAGFAYLGSNSNIVFDIINTGAINFNIDSLNIPDANSVFTIVTPINDYLLEAGDAVTVEIEFNPVEQKIYTDTLEIHSNCSNAPIKTVYLRGVGVTGTIVSEGEVSGTWAKAGSPYTVTGDIQVAKERTLTIEPGVVVKFAGHFKFTVGYRATLSAVGTEEENIVFTATDTDEGWFGLRFVNTDDNDRLEHCTLEYSKKTLTNEGSSFENIMGGAILCCGSLEADAGNYMPSSPTINHCLIANNYADLGGGIMLTDYSEAVITNNRIVDNSAGIGGGGIFTFYGGGKIANNIIAHNDTGVFGGGIGNMLGYPSITNNTIVHNRPNGLYLDITPLDPWDPDYGRPVLNNIIWQNEIYMEEDISEDEYVIRFNNIQGGSERDGNIDVDPCFADPENRDYHLRSEAGRWDSASESWVVDETTSPCINAGDPVSAIGDEPATNGGRINMGAYGGTTEASKSL